MEINSPHGLMDELTGSDSNTDNAQERHDRQSKTRPHEQNF